MYLQNFSPSGSHTILVFPHQKHYGNIRNIAITFGTEKLEWCDYPTVKKTPFCRSRSEWLGCCRSVISATLYDVISSAWLAYVLLFTTRRRSVLTFQPTVLAFSKLLNYQLPIAQTWAIFVRSCFFLYYQEYVYQSTLSWPTFFLFLVLEPAQTDSGLHRLSWY